MARARFPGPRHLVWNLLMVVRRALGLRPAALLVDEIRCPRCGEWVKPRRFDLRHMACRTCRATFARPRRTGVLLW
ncbi:hypothetical protein [Plantactinospora endophytica]|uniref:Transposase zinc-ribbon domain-containing protein n=1 Tax=Plantactinospora endophytica TaxID=673535 RepID=A0ABQ4E8D6_9ACTN|nr:hypothetical protein [Plantactinospora endophytica]GIG90935.1 hypothetical protein Pen02_58710 [Plantactinospora endophytica]